MKIPVSWLQDYISPKLETRALAEALERAGVEVEGIEYAPKLDKKIVVAKVIKVTKHPNADRLRLVTVNIGKSKLDVVCGAANVADGQTVALAGIGSVLPDGTKITAAEIRGVKSSGMICSLSELGMGSDHSGILVLDGNLPAGESLSSHVAADDVLDVKTAANRSDLVGLVGLAREVMAVGGGKLKLPETAQLKHTGDQRVQINTDKASRYMLTELKIDAQKRSPDWLIKHLRGAGIRPINLVVDVTNFVMLEWGQPLHAFDAGKVKLPVNVRLEEKDEKFTTLDNVKRSLTGSDLVVADQSGPIALAGVMGGKNSQVTDKSTRIYIESATFNGGMVRKTALRQGLRTDASARFERQLPEQVAAIAMARAVHLLTDLGGAKVVGQTSDLLTVWPWIQQIGLKTQHVSSLTGLTLKSSTIASKLGALGFLAHEFDIVTEVKKHLGKPYISGASFKTHGETAFDCSYLTERVYSRIGIPIGHTAHQQYKSGQPVDLKDLRPGDLVFRGGPWVLHDKKEREGVSHDAMYIGGGKIINTRDYVRDHEKWVQLPESERQVVIEDLESVTKDPEFLGARRYANDLSGWIAVTVPWWRPDVKLPEDLIEELVVQVGYDQIPATLPTLRPTQIAPDNYWFLLWELKSILRSLGLFEVNTYSFVSEQDLDKLKLQLNAHLKLRNPLSSNQAYLRRTLLPSLLNATSNNRHYAKQFGMYEISKVFWPPGGKGLPAEPTRLAVIVNQPGSAYSELKRVLDTVASGLNLDLSVTPSTYPEFSDLGVKIAAGGDTIGQMGEIKPEITAKYKLSSSVGYIELDLAALLASIKPRRFQEIPRFPSITRDLTVEIKQQCSWAQISKFLAAYNPQFLSDFTGQSVKPGHKKLAMRFEFHDPSRTLTENEAAVLLNRVIDQLKTKFKAQIS